ncbi:MAG: N-6 DNA methylase [Nanoarchaeota archaeon]|nr:N-6 DNA methylase [Nanoarchaeota archaeon]
MPIKYKPKEEIITTGEEKGLIKIRDGKVTYNPSSSHAKSDNYEDPEEKVRAALYVELVTKYKYDPKEIEKPDKYIKIGHPDKKTDVKIDLLVNKNGKHFMMFELKEPDKYERDMESSIKTQLFNVAPVLDPKVKYLKYLIYYTRYFEEKKLKEKIITIDYTKYKTYEDWEEAGRPNLMLIPKEYGIVRKPVFIKKGHPDLRIDVKKDELERIRWNLHNILWGGGKYQNELFFNLVGLFLTKIYDEKETEDGKPYQFQIFYEDGEPEKADKVYERINKYYKIALKEYLGYTDDELRKIKDIVFDAPKVKYVVEVLQDISFTISKYDIIGDFFEKIVRSEFKQTKGQYLTHQNIVNFIIRAIDLEHFAVDLINKEKRLPFVIDPACGSGTFLIESMKLITSHVLLNKGKLKKSESVKNFLLSNFPEYQKNIWAKEFTYGIEINGDLATATKVNMVGHGDGSSNIEAKDAFFDFEKFKKSMLQIKKSSNIYQKYVNEQYDVVISNPPFSVTVDRDTAKKFPEIFLWGEKIADRLKKSKKEMEVSTENLFIERWYQLLKPKGRLGVVLPESVFDTTANRYIRLFLYKYFWVKAVVSLPHLAFAPYTMTKTSLLFAEKKTPEEVKEWDQLWNKYLDEYNSLRQKIDELLKTKKEDVDYQKNKERLISKLIELLGDNFEENDKKLDVGEIKEKYKDEIKLADSDWWVFKKVSEKLNYKIFMAHAEEIGYKRGVRGEEVRKNQLFQIDEERNIIIDTKNPKTILDYLRRSVKWKY